MGFFNRSPPPLLPSNLPELLADWGRHQFDRSAHPEVSPETDGLITSLTLSDAIREHRLEAIQQIAEAGLSTGGWSVCGAWNVLHANFLAPVPEDLLARLSEERVRFLRTLGLPDLKLRMNSEDIVTHSRLFPEEHAALFPGWDD